MACVPEMEIQERIGSLQKLLVAEGVDAALITQNADLFYFTGAVNRAYFYIPAVGEPILFIARGAERLHDETTVRRVVVLNHVKEMPSALRQMNCLFPERLGVESDVVPASLFFRYESIFSPARLVDVSALIRRVRSKKSAWEIEKIRDACKMGRSIFNFVENAWTEGLTEFELCGKIESFARKIGHPGLMRARGYNQEMSYVLILSGVDAVLPSYNSGPLGGKGATAAFPYGPSNRCIMRNEPVIVDQSPWVEGYMADMTRVFVRGNLPVHMCQAYETARIIQEMIVEKARPGAVCSELWSAARQIVRTHGFCEHFMGMMRQVSFVGHGVGLEVDEWPVIGPGADAVLAEGMVLAIEPKFVFPDGAVGLENTFVVGKKGLETLVDMDDEIRQLRGY